jgi:ABC-type Zn uptake system ZnuABC Zn-binding protein ZnuA
MDFSYQSDKFIFVRYVDLIKNTDAVLEELEKKMEIKKKSLSRFKLRRPKKVPQSDAFHESKRAYYLNEEYLNKYSAKEIQTLNNLLDQQVISFLGYELRNSVKDFA